MVSRWGTAKLSPLCMVALAWAVTARATFTPAQSCEKAKDQAVAKYGQCIAAQRTKEIAGKVPAYGGVCD